MEYHIWNGNVTIRNGTFSTERKEQPTDFSWRRVCLFWLVQFVQLLAKCPSHTKLCQECSGTVNLSIPSVMLFQTACNVRTSVV